MDNLFTMCLLGIFLLVGFMLLSRMMRGMAGGGRYAGGQRPEYDDPNIQSRGSFGRSGGGLFNRPRYNDPNIQSRGSFGRSGGSSPSSPPSTRPSSSGGRVDSPNIQSRGGFGRSKK